MLRTPMVLALSVVAAVLASATSLAGILWPATYARETPAWAVQAVGQDAANLLVVVVLLTGAERARRGSMRGLLVWLGCLLYLVYAFAIYSFAVHFNTLFLAYVAVLGLSFYALVGALAGVDMDSVAAPLRDHPQRRSAAALLVAIGVVFAALWLAQIVPHLLDHTTPADLAATGLWTNPVHVLDLAFLLPAMIVVGVLLPRQHPWGLLLAVPMLVFAVTMGMGILTLFALSARAGLPVSAPAVVVVAAIVALSALHTWLLLRPRAPVTS